MLRMIHYGDLYVLVAQDPGHCRLRGRRCGIPYCFCYPWTSINVSVNDLYIMFRMSSGMYFRVK
jgi:hypothetical protein